MSDPEEKSCDDCTKNDYCPFKGEVCPDYSPKQKKDENDPLAGIDIPTINDAGWQNDPCIDPVAIIDTIDGSFPLLDIKEETGVLTHNAFQRVSQVYSRQFNGEAVGITPYYSNVETRFTPKHPIPAIKTVKKCPVVNPHRQSFRVCLSSCSSKDRLKCERYFENYKVELLTADQLEKGDVVLSPRQLGNDSEFTINLLDYADRSKSFTIGSNFYCHSGNKLKMNDALIQKFILQVKNNVPAKETQKSLGISKWMYRCWLHRLHLKPNLKITSYEHLPEFTGVFPKEIKVDEDFCSLVGYFVSEGDAHNHQTRFSFNKDETESIAEVKEYVQKIFARPCSTSINRQVARIVVHGVPIVKMMRTLFGTSCETKHLPDWFILLTKNLLRKFIEKYFRGDGYSKGTGRHGVQATTVSPKLAFQLRIILHKLGYHCGVFYENGNDVKLHYIEGRLIKNNQDQYRIHLPSKTSVDLLNSMGGVVSSPCHRRPYGWVDDYYVYTCIKKTQRIPYAGVVKNLGVEKANIYTVNGFLVHNCYRPC